MTNDFFSNLGKQTSNIEGPPLPMIKRGWGSSVVLDANTRIHFINDEPSVHYHRIRTEEYILLNGSMVVYRGENNEGDLLKTVASLEPTTMLPGDRVVMPPGVVHVPVNLSPDGSTFIEISHGPYEESDIERIYDKASRHPDLRKRWTKLGYREGLSIVDLVASQNKKEWVQTEMETKLVVKPWGNGKLADTDGVGELWLNYDRGEDVGKRRKRYVFKKLYIKKGTRTSFQYHKKKFETNHLIVGEAEAWMENKKGEIEKSLFKAGDTWTIPNGKKHRLIALTDLVMLEASTPEVDDVIRIKDDTDRGSGRIQSEHIK